MRDRLLTWHFLQRFLENDLLSPDADRHDAIAMVGGGLLTLGMVLSLGISMKFLFMPFQSPGRTVVLAVDDRLLFVTLSMIVTALIAVATWDALSLDPRDTAIFGPLPIPHRVIVLGKLRAVAILAGGFSLALSSLSSLLHPVLMIAKLPIGFFVPVALIAIHLAITIGAGLFGFASVLVVREVLRAALGVRFTQISALLQAVLIVALVATFLLLPAILGGARYGQTPRSRLMPPVWFVALHESLAGDLVAGLPRGALPSSVIRQEDRAMGRYREISATLRPLAWRAVVALALTLIVGIGAYFWNSRQLPLPLVGHRTGRYRGPGLLPRLAALTIARSPATQAGFFFTLQCLFLSGPHRVVMAGCTAISLALATVLIGAASRSAGAHPAEIPVYVFTTQTFALGILLGGFRHATRLPANIAANRLFRLAWVADPTRFVAGVRRGALVGVVVPLVVALLPPGIYVMGPDLALKHALTGILLGAAVLTVLTVKPLQLPFVASYVPAGDLNTVGPVILIGGLISVSIFSRIERVALMDAQPTAILWGILAAVVVLPRLFAWRNPELTLPTAFDVPAPGTTRLDLG